MRLVSSSKDNKQYALDKENYSINFTLMDMGTYIGHRYRQWYETAPEIWKAMGIDIESKDPSKSIHSEFLVDDKGDLLRALIIDSNGIKRARQYYNDPLSRSKEDEEFYRGKGVSKVNGRWVQDSIIVPGNNPLGIGKSYYYDEETGKFIDENGQEAPESVVSNFELPELLATAGKQVSEKFTQLRGKTENVPDEIDIDDEISL